VPPFDIKSTLLAKHAQHVVLTHFPIALFLTSVMLDFPNHTYCHSREPLSGWLRPSSPGINSRFASY
jgi:uncharacterized membrane protein